MKVKEKLSVANEFADNPGARDREDGPNSGQEFLEEYLLKRFDKAVEDGYILEIDFDGLWGFPSSFVSGSFGRLSMDKGHGLVLKHLQFKSEKNPMRIDKVIEEIKNPTGKNIR